MDKYLSLLNKYGENLSEMKQVRISGTQEALAHTVEINNIVKHQMCANVESSNVNHAVAEYENKIEEAKCKIRVGRIRNANEPGTKIPITEGYTNIVVTSHNQTKIGHSLSPYKLADSKGRLMENLWQFAKIYPKVHKQTQKDWSWDEEVHMVDGEPTPEYWEWRQAGMEHDKPIRYPNGFAGKAECDCVLWPKSGKLSDICNPEAPMERLSYIEARKRVYCKLYVMMAKKNEELQKLRAMLDKGNKLQILDVDGPDVSKATSKKKPYTVKAPYDKIPTGAYGTTSGVGSIEITEENIKLLMEDVDQPFGHGYVLACLLLDHTDWMH